MIHCIVVLFLALLQLNASAQTGRSFVSAEAYAGASRFVKVGKIVELEKIDYNKPRTYIQKLGKPYKLVFEVAETIRGDESKRLELVLALQSTWALEYMRDYKLETMLVGGPHGLDRFPTAEIGIEEEGKHVDENERYQFRLLDPVKIPEDKEQAEYARMLNHGYDQCRMFTSNFQVITGSKEILPAVRAFAKQHPKILPLVTVSVPNEFGALVGDPNAYCGIIMPVCPETKATLVALKADPGLILDRIKSDPEFILKRFKESNEAYKKYYRPILTESLDKALAEFPAEGGKSAK